MSKERLEHKQKIITYDVTNELIEFLEKNQLDYNIDTEIMFWDETEADENMKKLLEETKNE